MDTGAGNQRHVTNLDHVRGLFERELPHERLLVAERLLFAFEELTAFVRRTHHRHYERRNQAVESLCQRAESLYLLADEGFRPGEGSEGNELVCLSFRTDLYGGC